MKGSPDASGSKSNTPLCIAQMSNLELDDMKSGVLAYSVWPYGLKEWVSVARL